MIANTARFRIGRALGDQTDEINLGGVFRGASDAKRYVLGGGEGAGKDLECGRKIVWVVKNAFGDLVPRGIGRRLCYRHTTAREQGIGGGWVGADGHAHHVGSDRKE